MKIAIVDDRESEALQLKNAVMAYSSEDDPFTVDVYQNGLLLLDNKKKKYDAVFLDIDMPVINGLEVGAKLRKGDKDLPIVFVTRYASLAINGYEVSAIDFLVKPVKEKDVFHSLEKIKEHLDAKKNDYKLLVKIKHGYKALMTSQILYIEVMSHSIFFHCIDETFEGYGTLKSLEKEIEKQHFCKCSNCYLVNLDYVDSVVGDNVLIGGETLPISRAKKKEFIAKFIEVVK